MGEESKLLFVCVLSQTGVPVRRARSSLTYPTPWTGPNASPYLVHELSVRSISKLLRRTRFYNTSPNPRSTQNSGTLPG